MGLLDIIEALLQLVDRHPGGAIVFTVVGVMLCIAAAYGLFCVHVIRVRMVTREECAQHRVDYLQGKTAPSRVLLSPE
jgi:hypothetical protein